MNRKLVILVGLLGLSFELGADALACGDKLLVVGRGLRPKRKAASHASILAFAPATGSLPAALGEGGLQQDLERAGHRLSRVATDDELRKALGEGGYDLVLADFATAARVEAETSRTPAHPTVLPTLYKPTPAQLQAAESAFQCVIASPGKPRDYLSVVDEAMAARARQAKAGKAPK